MRHSVRRKVFGPDTFRRLGQHAKDFNIFEEMDRMDTIVDANKALLHRAWAAYDRGDEDGFRACLADAWQEYDLSSRSGNAQEVTASMQAHRIAFPDKHTEM